MTLRKRETVSVWVCVSRFTPTPSNKMEQTEESIKRRGPAQAAWAMAENLVYFLAPMVLADRAAQGLRPLLMDPEDLRGPWECLWHKVSR